MDFLGVFHETVSVAPPPEPVKVIAPAPPSTPDSSNLSSGEVATGVALGALPWLAAPIVALAAARPLLQKVSRLANVCTIEQKSYQRANRAPVLVKLQGLYLNESLKKFKDGGADKVDRTYLSPLCFVGIRQPCAESVLEVVALIPETTLVRAPASLSRACLIISCHDEQSVLA